MKNNSLNNPLLSVIIPVHNSQDYVVECIDSVLMQTYKNLEIIIVENGSTDKSYSICKKFAEIHNNVILISSNVANVSQARNLGLNKSKGKYVGFVDSDDKVQSDMYLTMIKQLEKCKVDVVMSGFTESDSEDVSICYSGLLETKMIDFTKLGTPFIWRCVFRSDIIRSNKILFNEQLNFSEDVLFFFDYIRFSKTIYFLNEYYPYLLNIENKDSLTRRVEPVVAFWQRRTEYILFIKSNIDVYSKIFNINYYLANETLLQFYSYIINFYFKLNSSKKLWKEHKKFVMAKLSNCSVELNCIKQSDDAYTKKLLIYLLLTGKYDILFFILWFYARCRHINGVK